MKTEALFIATAIESKISVILTEKQKDFCVNEELIHFDGKGWRFFMSEYDKVKEEGKDNPQVVEPADKNKYVIVGSNNYWYKVTGKISKEELKEEIEEVKQGIKDGTYQNSGDNQPERLFVYTATETQRVEL